MAQYKVEHLCGHTHTYQLYGKTSDRERKMEWLATLECPECRRKSEIAQLEADNSPITAKAIPTICETNHPEWVTLDIEFCGGTYNRRDDLKAMGAEYGEVLPNAGLFGLLSMRERKAWHKVCHLTADDVRRVLEKGDNSALVEAVRSAAGLTEDMAIELPGADDPNAALLIERMKAVIELDKQMAGLPPEPPLWSLRERMGKSGCRWNGKFYGRDGLTVYLDGVETKVPADLKAEWQESRKAHEKWQAMKDAMMAAAKQGE